jgi:Mn-dependent DtxR family transcriptional regulator
LLEQTRALTREVANNPEFYASDAALDEAHRLEHELEKSTVKRLREAAWMETLQTKDIVLIDTPDYSKSDRRLMAKDLEEIYWLWNTLASSSSNQPNIVLAIQKEMFRGHFFFDKMRIIELRPLRPEQMIEAYMRRFKSADPFTEEALSTVARMSRGIFRRFLRYILLVIESWETRPKPRGMIDLQMVQNAVTVERLAEDMELELVELFPKQSDLRLQAVRLLMHLEESGPNKQAELAEELGLEGYAMSRLLAKLELHRYVVRRREGTDKLVSLVRT